jgi:hypothetical protein
MPWFHSKIDREQTERCQYCRQVLILLIIFRILRGRSNGTFLIRNSTNFPDGYTLCVSFNGKVEHYRIYLTNNNQFTCDHEEFFDNLIQLVSVSAAFYLLMSCIFSTINGMLTDFVTDLSLHKYRTPSDNNMKMQAEKSSTNTLRRPES